MQVEQTSLPGVLVLTPKRFGDSRGFFSETYSRRVFEAAGIACEFVQDNHSLSAEKGVVRGLHFQLPPMAQDKLVRVIAGSVLDVAVDIRRSSPTFGKHVSAMLSASNGRQMFVPAGFAHGFVTLEPRTEVVYKVSRYYSPQHDRGIRWDDPALALDWGVEKDRAVLSEKDRLLPLLQDAAELF